MRCGKVGISIITLDITLLGGIERVISVLANHFVSDGYEVNIYSVFKKNENPSYDFCDGVNIIYLNDGDGGTGLKRYFKMVKAIRYVRRYDKNECMISTLTNISCIYGFLNYIKFQHFIAAEHSQYNAHSRIVRWLRAIAYRKAKYVVTLTEHDKILFSRFINSERLVVINNPSSFLSDYMTSSLESKRLISIGRLVDVKNFSFLLRELSVFLLANPDWHLDIYGDGELKGSLVKLTESLGISQSVSFRGFVKDIKSEISDASFYLCSSKTEAFPMAFIEALSFGLPIISVNCPFGPSEIILDGVNGYLIDSDYSYESFNSCLESIKKDCVKYKRMQSEAFYSSKKYDVAVIASKWYELIFR
nr:glycosyl transferase [Plesiomonas shigelloides]